MTRSQSHLVAWTVESNPDDGSWALFARVGGDVVQLTAWHPTKASLLAAVQAITMRADAPGGSHDDSN